MHSNEELLFAPDDEPEEDQQVPEPWIILIVDDEEDVHQATKLVFATQKKDGRNFLCESAYSGGQGLSRILDASLKLPHIVIMDIVMDYDTDGIDAAHAIRKALEQRNIPYLIIRTGQAGSGMNGFRNLAEDDDIDHVLLKSEITAARLIDAVAAGLDKVSRALN